LPTSDSATPISITQRHLFGDFDVTTTDRDGRFTFDSKFSTVIAMRGDQWGEGRLQDGELEIKLAPTGMLEGRVELGDIPAGRAKVTVDRLPFYRGVAPVQPDGRFQIRGVPFGEISIGATRVDRIAPRAHEQKLTIDQPKHTGVELTLDRGDDIHVVIRSATTSVPTAAVVYILPKVELPRMTVGGILDVEGLALPYFARKIDPQHVPRELAGKVKDGDLVLTTDPRPDEGIICAAGLTYELEREQRRFGLGRKDPAATAFFETLDVGCFPFNKATRVMFVAVPAIRTIR
jgi:hypothetical protein